MDYIAEVLKRLRDEDFTSSYNEHFEIASEVSTRDQIGFEKTFSGMMKILYPDGKATPKEIEELLYFAMEARRRVREHILRIDDTFKRNDFSYRPLAGGVVVKVQTPEEIQYPTFAAPRRKIAEEDSSESAANDLVPSANEAAQAPAVIPAERATEVALQPEHIVVPENSKGWSYRRLFAQHLKGARKITVSDPYVRLFFQVRNMMEFLEMVHEITPEGDEVSVHLITQSDPDTCVYQDENLNQVVTAFTGSRVVFTWELNHNPNFHARSIVTDSGWKISIDRGLDLFQKFEAGPFSIEQAIQEARLTKGAEITYLRI